MLLPLFHTAYTSHHSAFTHDTLPALFFVFLCYFIYYSSACIQKLGAACCCCCCRPCLPVLFCSVRCLFALPLPPREWCIFFPFDIRPWCRCRRRRLLYARVVYHHCLARWNIIRCAHRKHNICVMYSVYHFE